jgi:hypothetical protein
VIEDRLYFAHPYIQNRAGWSIRLSVRNGVWMVSRRGRDGSIPERRAGVSRGPTLDPVRYGYGDYGATVYVDISPVLSTANAATDPARPDRDVTTTANGQLKNEVPSALDHPHGPESRHFLGDPRLIDHFDNLVDVLVGRRLLLG